MHICIIPGLQGEGTSQLMTSFEKDNHHGARRGGYLSRKEDPCAPVLPGHVKAAY